METIMYWLFVFAIITFLVDLLILLPFCIFRKTKLYASIGLVCSSYIFGITLWFSGFNLTFELWGIVALIIGLAVVGLGVIPMAILATILNGLWSELILLVILGVLAYGTRILGLTLSDKEHQYQKKEGIFYD